MLSNSEIKARATDWALFNGLSLEQAKDYAEDYLKVRGSDQASEDFITIYDEETN
jgi:hypothetical protein